MPTPRKRFPLKPVPIDFSGHEGEYVAYDRRTGEIVLSDKDPHVVLAQAKGRKHVVVHGRVPYADEPLYVGMG
jgi:hypothetical protein